MALEVTYDALKDEVARELGWNRNWRETDVWSADQNSDYALILDSGLRKFYGGEIPGENTAHQWSFLYPLAEIELSAAYSTGTIQATASTTVTLSGGTWPAWADEGELWYTSDAGGEQIKATIATRSSDTEILLDTATAAADVAAAGTSYKLRRVHYNLPDDFAGMESDGFTFRRDQQWHLPSIKLVGEADLRRLDRENSGDIYPRYASITPIAVTSSSTTRWQVRFFPLADTAYTVEYRYKSVPVTTGTHPAGGAFYGEAITAAVLDAAQQRIHSSNERHADFLSAMRQAVFHDRRAFAKHTLGKGATDKSRRGNTLSEFRRNTPLTNINLNWS